MSDKNIDKEILIEFTDGKKAKILDIKDINTEKIIQDLSKRLIDKNKELETYKKIAENLLEVSDEEKAEAYFQEYIGKNNDNHDEFEYFFEKARKEVENEP